MFANHLRFTFRSLWKNKTYSFINIFGLAVGIACFMLILLWVRNELSYDQFHSNAENIYRIIQHDQDGKNARTPALLAPALSNKIPEVTEYVRLVKLPRLIFQKESSIYYEDRGVVADPEFLTMFDYPLVRGNPETALDDPASIILSESLAKKYFKDQNPVNQTILIDGENEVMVSGVINNRSGQSHIQFDFILSFRLWELISAGDIQNWGAFNYTSYVQLNEDSETAAVTEKVNQLAEAKLPQQILEFWDDYSLQPITAAHLSADIANDHFLGNFTLVEDRTTVYIFLTIAFFILLIACINFMNLSTARSGTRTREIGMKKVIGSTRSQLVRQFLAEFFLYSVIAFGFAIILLELALPYFNQMSGKTLTINHLNNLLPYMGIMSITTLLGGLYPALYLSSFKPIRILKGQLSGSGKSDKMRSLLVVFQFTISIILIAGTITVNKQLGFVQNKNLGFQKENIIYLPISGSAASRYATLKTELQNKPDVFGVTAKDCLPTNTLRNLIDYYWDEKAPGQEVLMELTGVDYNYFEMLDIDFVEGRSFSTAYSNDAAGAFILNEEAVERTGIQSPVGKSFATWNKSGTIVGVIKNTNFKSLHQEVNPQVYHVMNDIGAEASLTGVILVRINGANQAKALAEIASIWNSLVPDVPFEYHFLDQTYDQLYSSELRTRTVINWFSIIALIIAGLGLFGLTTHIAETRKKEIGIRKTLGAGVQSILIMLTSGYAKLVLVSTLIAWPVAYYFMHQWLQNFAYRIALNWWVFVISGLAVLCIALVTVSWQAIRAATANPVEALRYE